MSEFSNDDALAQVVAVLKEGYYGPAAGWSYFTDAGPESGLQGTLAWLTSAQASRDVGDTSIAAHAFHVAFGFESSEAWIRGDQSSKDWPGSWRVRSVDEQEWDNLRERLRERFEHLLQAIEERALSSETTFGAAVGAAAHQAYHLAAIRQKAIIVRGGMRTP